MHGVAPVTYRFDGSQLRRASHGWEVRLPECGQLALLEDISKYGEWGTIRVEDEISNAGPAWVIDALNEEVARNGLVVACAELATWPGMTLGPAATAWVAEHGLNRRADPTVQIPTAEVPQLFAAASLSGLGEIQGRLAEIRSRPLRHLVPGTGRKLEQMEWDARYRRRALLIIAEAHLEAVLMKSPHATLYVMRPAVAQLAASLRAAGRNTEAADLEREAASRN